MGDSEKISSRDPTQQQLDTRYSETVVSPAPQNIYELTLCETLSKARHIPPLTLYMYTRSGWASERATGDKGWRGQYTRRQPTKPNLKRQLRHTQPRLVRQRQARQVVGCFLCTWCWDGHLTCECVSAVGCLCYNRRWRRWLVPDPANEQQAGERKAVRRRAPSWKVPRLRRRCWSGTESGVAGLYCRLMIISLTRTPRAASQQQWTTLQCTPPPTRTPSSHPPIHLHSTRFVRWCLPRRENPSS